MINKTVTYNYLNKERTIDNFILLINNCSMTENGVDIMSHIFQRKHLHNAITISTLNWSISSLDLHSSHNNDVIMNATASQPVLRLFTQLFIQSQIKENMKAPRYWPLWGEFTGEFPAQKVSNAKNVSIWWRHHANMLNENKTCKYAHDVLETNMYF